MTTSSAASKTDTPDATADRYVCTGVKRAIRLIDRILNTFLEFEETPESRIFPNEEFGYWKVTVERPHRLHSQLTIKAIESLRFSSGDEAIRSTLYEEFGDDLFTNFSIISKRSCSTRRHGSVTAGLLKPFMLCVPSLVNSFSKTTTSSARTSPQHSCREVSSCPQPT